MICNNCGNQINDNSNFCPKCGMNINNSNLMNNNNSINVVSNYNQNLNNTFNNFSQTVNKNSKKFSVRKAIILGLIILLFLLVVMAIVIFKNSNKTRTVMIYLAGSDLESKSQIVSVDLDAIDPKSIDLNNTNILLYTGGTEKWHNFIKNDENAIYVLKKDGFEKVKSYDKKNMGDPNTLTEFLNYSYENYQASEYNFIFYDHGGAIDGAIYDDFTNDNLSLSDMNNAFKNSHFSEKNKLQTVLFRTCLNGTVEVASLFSKYSDYMIASEEVTYGSNYTNVLSFLNNVSSKDDGVEFGKKFIDSYNDQMKIIDSDNSVTTTYSIIDLSKVDKLTEELNKYFSSINVNKNYIYLSQNRNKMYQYGVDDKRFDMVDLYELTKMTNDYSDINNSSLLKAIKNAIVFNNSNTEDSYGLSIYFPYNSNVFLRDYSGYSKFENYNKFISAFTDIKNKKVTNSFSFSPKQFKADDKNKITFQLSDEQYNNFGKANYYIFKRDPDHPNYFFYIYLSNNSELDSNGLLTVSLSDSFVKMMGTEGYEYIPVTNIKNGNQESLTVPGILYDNDLDIFDPNFMNSVRLTIKEKNSKLTFTTAKLISNNERLNGTMLNIKDYEIVDIFKTRRRLLDDNGNFIKDMEEWESSPELVGIEAKLNTDDVSLIKSGLDEEGEYYCVFEIFDVNNNSILSDLIRIGG